MQSKMVSFILQIQDFSLNINKLQFDEPDAGVYKAKVRTHTSAHVHCTSVEKTVCLIVDSACAYILEMHMFIV